MRIGIPHTHMYAMRTAKGLILKTQVSPLLLANLDVDVVQLTSSPP